MTVLVDSVSTLVDTWETFYTAPEATTVTAFTATNIAGNNASFKVAIVTSLVREIINHQIIVTNRSYPGWELVNQEIPRGAALQFQTSEVGGIHFYVSGV